MGSASPSTLQPPGPFLTWPLEKVSSLHLRRKGINICKCLFHRIPRGFCKEDIVPFSQMSRWRLREVEWLTQSHTAQAWQNSNLVLNPPAFYGPRPPPRAQVTTPLSSFVRTCLESLQASHPGPSFWSEAEGAAPLGLRPRRLSPGEMRQATFLSLTDFPRTGTDGWGKCRILLNSPTPRAPSWLTGHLGASWGDLSHCSSQRATPREPE